jgi:hypothetical protein
MIITSYSNIDLIQGVISYGNATEGITDWRIENTGAGIFNINNSSSIIRPSGGTSEIGQITNSSDRYMIFKGGTSTFTVPAGGIVCDILVVGGGGSGGAFGGGGGGGGDVIYQQNISFPAGTYNINVGSGGTSTTGSDRGNNGANSSISGTGITTITAVGGGGGAGYNQSSIAVATIGTSSGGGGGGTGQNPNTAGATSQYSGAGGNGVSSFLTTSGGGGGSVGVGGTATIKSKAGNGGIGNDISIIGISQQYGGGGGGGNWAGEFTYTAPNIGGGTGVYGGGDGAYTSNSTNYPAINGTPNTGGGGGGGGGITAGGIGGSGIVIIRYRTTNISIIDNGNIGIGTTPISSSSKLEIYGDVNISGNYKLNNRDIINDTSNYMLITSNVLIPRIITEVGHGSNYVNRIATQINTSIDDTSNYVAITSSLLANRVGSQWANISTGIHYTPTPYSITSTPVATTVGTAGIFTYMTFTYTTETAGAGTGQTLYTINVPTGGVICDILIVGGGGGGGSGHGGGGGAGQLVLIKDAVLNQSYTIRVGSGGIYSISQERANSRPATKGKNSTFGSIIAEGGGACTNISADMNGGSGAGGDGYPTDGGTYGFGVKDNNPDTFSSGNVYSRGNNGASNTGFTGGGGGGAGVAGNVNVGGDGLSGITEINFDFLQSFGSSVGQYISAENKVYFAGGGGGGASSVNNISKGGGGIGNGSSAGGSGLANTGSGGGGGGGGGQDGGNGGSGIVIIRYLSSTRNVGIGTTNPTSELHVFDDTTTNTKLTVQNNFVEPIVISPNTIGYTVAETLESSKFYRTITFNYFPNYPPDPPNTALLAWYRFDGNGLDYNPYATKYNLIANSGTPTYSSGTSEDSFFQGRRYINTAAGSLRSTTLALQSRAFSIALWIRPKSTSELYFIGQGNASSINGTFAVGFRTNIGYVMPFGGNDLECGTGVSGGPTSYPGDVNNWVHIVYVVLPNFNRRMYRNGVLISQDSNTSAFFGLSDFKIGSNPWTAVLNNIDISDLRIYNNGLSDTEVATLYASYMNLVITDNYSINFKSPTTLLVNGTSRTVNGTYALSMGHLNDSMLPASGQTDIPLASTVLTSLPIKYEYSNTALSLPALITVSGATSSFIGTTERAISFTYTSDSPGLTGQTEYTFTPTEDLLCDILIVGGGGGGGKFGGGGGGGGVLFGANLKINNNSSVSIKVGNGGTGGTIYNGGINGVNGVDSSITINSIEYIAKGGGGGGSRAEYGAGTTGSPGGSGGGGSGANVYPQGMEGVSNKNNYANFQSFGNNGGKGRPNVNSPQPVFSSGGGGGAGSVGSDFSNITGGGNGGSGKEFISYFGTNIGHYGFFAGGGGGDTYDNAGNVGYGNGGLGLYGGGGSGGYDGTLITQATPALANTGGGGGGSTEGGVGGNGGSGFVIIRYRKNVAQSSSLELITSSPSINITEPAANGTKQFPETPSTTADTWVDNGFTVVCKTSDGILGSQYNTGMLFNNVISSPDYYHSTQLFNGSSPFNYTSSTSFKGANGLVLYIDLGRSIILRSMRIMPRDNAAFPSLNFLGGVPGIFKIYASNESACWNSNTHASWIEIHSQTTSLTFGYNIFTNFGNFSSINTPYRYFAMVVYNLTGSYGYLMMSEWDIFGEITPVVIDNNHKYLSLTHSGGSEAQTSYTVNFPETTTCDILIVGGGGGGGCGMGGGGGGGQVIYATNVNIPIGTYNILVGSGGAGAASTNGTNGNNSSAFGATANGGGGGGGVGGWSGSSAPGLAGGSGGGGGANSVNAVQAAGTVKVGAVGSILASALTYGNAGGSGLYNASGGGGAGGGGAGAVGTSANSIKASGGNGIIINITGQPYYWAGGGGGASWSTAVGSGNGGLGGGGAGANGAGIGAPGINGLLGININIVRAISNGKGADGANNTGGGGGGGTYNAQVGGKGGSGIVIIKYKSSTRLQGYSVGNYNGDFKIISTSSSISSTNSSTIFTDTDYMRITRDGASIYNPTGSPLWSTVSDRRIKENIEKASYDKCYESINKLELYRFSYIKELNNINKDLKQLGYIAQEVKDIFPKAVSTQEFYNENLSISDMLSIDITQINYSLYGAVKKLMEMYSDKKERLQKLKYLLNISDSYAIDTSNLLDTTSNISIDTSNILIDTSNLLDTTSNISIDTSNISIDTSNISIDTINISIDTSNISIDTSNISIDTSNISIDTSNQF